MQTSRIYLLIIGVVLLGTTYIFQRVDVVAPFKSASSEEVYPYFAFIANKTARLILNDTAMCFLIAYFFKDKKYLRIGLVVFLLELLVFLPAYLAIKLATEGAGEISSPILAQFHRLLVNPMLMILLLFGFWFQQLQVQQKDV